MYVYVGYACSSDVRQFPPAIQFFVADLRHTVGITTFSKLPIYVMWLGVYVCVWVMHILYCGGILVSTM